MGWFLTDSTAEGLAEGAWLVQEASEWGGCPEIEPAFAVQPQSATWAASLMIFRCQCL